ncbi:MAG: TetR family transcriptional regulator [Novosphingobium sp.]
MTIELAALRLLAETGDENIAMQTVADEIGISRRTFYRYYPSVHDALVAVPLRSLARISDDFRARPDTESLREAFVKAIDQGEPSTATELVAEIRTKHPMVWHRIVSQMQPPAIDFFENMVRERLHRSGQDARLARLAGAVLVGVIETQSPLLNDQMAVDPLEEALAGVIELLRA